MLVRLIVVAALMADWALPARAVDCDATKMGEHATILCVMDLVKEMNEHPERFRIDEGPMEALDRAGREMCAELKAMPDSEEIRRISEAACSDLLPQPSRF
jgi:hypothetical protein